MDARIDANDASMAEAILKAMNNREPTSGKNGTRVRKAIRNGSHWSCVGEDQDDFRCVEQVGIGSSKMDNGIESNNGLKMDQEWNQVFAMMEQIELGLAL